MALIPLYTVDCLVEMLRLSIAVLDPSEGMNEGCQQATNSSKSRFQLIP